MMMHILEGKYENYLEVWRVFSPHNLLALYPQPRVAQRNPHGTYGSQIFALHETRCLSGGLPGDDILFQLYPMCGDGQSICSIVLGTYANRNHKSLYL